MKKICLIIILSFTVFVLLKKREALIAFTHHEIEEEENEEGEMKTDEPGKFLEFHRGIRTREGEAGPAYPANYKWNELQLIRSNQFARKRNSAGRTKTNGVISWDQRGPGNVPGRTRALYNIPGDAANNTWLAGAATGGIWRTTNGGSTWTEVSIGFPALPISSFSGDADATVIYAGSGEFVSSVFSAIGNGIFKSSDKGLTWTQIPSTNNNPDFSIISRLVVDPANANIIVVATVPDNLTIDNTSAIMRSTDGGASWTKVKEITGILEQVIATPGNFNVQYASQNGAGVWKSTDAGLTWNLSKTGMSPSGRVEISVSPVTPSKVFASAEGTLSGSQSDLYVSSNSGSTWSLVDVKFNTATVDFLEGQGFYDNTIMCDPFDENGVYFGGVSLFKATLVNGSTSVDNFKIQEVSTKTFLFLQSFANIAYDSARLSAGASNNGLTVEVRFGPGKTQKAHRFLTPLNATSGVQAIDYTYQNYVNVPFEVWDVANNKKLMVSFRDQNRNGKFDLVPSALQTTDPAINQSREYLYINNVDYDATAANPSIAQAGGHEFHLMYNFFPALASGAVWDENNLPVSKLIIKNNPILKLNATIETVADGRGAFDNKNKSNQTNLSQGVHPDHHFMVPVIVNSAQKTFKILLANDGGVFVSKVSASPGITEGDWQFKGTGYNTSQFYGADKKPGSNEYIGGMQDNGTRYSPAGENASATSNYIYGLGGDGFEVIWNNKDAAKILGSVYNGQISRTLNGGTTWASATTGLNPSSTEFSFLTKLANSKNLPDRVFTVGTQGVYVSQDFGGQWQLTAIPNKFVISTPFYLDVEVSRANANIVWAGSGMNNTGTQRNLFVSKDGGATFSSTNNFTIVTLGNITKLASHPAEENTAYALFSFAHGPKILRTTDLGQTWEDISGFGTGSASTNGFPDVAVFCLYVRPDNPNILWAGTEIGIVESLDNGQTWALINDFPNVSVWDMKGQDDQVVIATHGRGIWTATIDTPQETVHAPEIIISGTSPLGSLMLRIKSIESFDSLEAYVGTVLSKTIKNVSPGVTDAGLTNISAGAKEIKVVGYKGNSPYQSQLYKMNHLSLLAAKNSYSTYFTSIADLSVNGLTLQSFPNTGTLHRQALQTSHPFSINSNNQIIIRTPVNFSASLPVLYYSDIAIIEPAGDSVIVEATKNGLDWIRLAPAYDATYENHWMTAYSTGQPGTASMFKEHEINYSGKFNAGDVLLFRLRMVSGPTVTSWGWGVDYISIQVTPLAVENNVAQENLSLYPNPTRGDVNIDYTLKRPSSVSLHVMDVFGRTVTALDLGLKNSGLNSETINLNDQQTGTYMVVLKTNEGKKTTKIVLHR